jgi:hypothetical protein
MIDVAIAGMRIAAAAAPDAMTMAAFRGFLLLPFLALTALLVFLVVEVWLSPFFFPPGGAH